MKFLKVLIAVLLLAGCRDKKAEEKTVAHGYYYFPKPNVYYDTADKNFIYFDTATREWITGSLPTQIVRSDMGRSILIDSAPQPVWSANRQHQLVYSAKLYADSSDFKKPPPPPPPSTATADEGNTDTTNGSDLPAERKKTKVGELLEKIFGKKKNNN